MEKITLFSESESNRLSSEIVKPQMSKKILDPPHPGLKKEQPEKAVSPLPVFKMLKHSYEKKFKKKKRCVAPKPGILLQGAASAKTQKWKKNGCPMALTAGSSVRWYLALVEGRSKNALFFK